MKVLVETYLGSCCGDERMVWLPRDVTSHELKELLDNGESIKVVGCNICRHFVDFNCACSIHGYHPYLCINNDYKDFHIK